jgi:DNA-directed RNA polymerase, mitochondrial
VREALVREAGQGSPFGAALKDKITRKVVKQTVMTNVYGVTFIGAKKQVLKQLETLYPTLAQDSGLEVILCASYIATHIFKALSTMFRGAHDIQHYLCEIGGRVCDSISPERVDFLSGTGLDKAKKAGTKKTAAAAAEDPKGELHSTIIWTTPLRMPVVQPYRKSTSKTIQTCLQNLVLISPDKFDPVDKGKQLQGFPPNFIHSLDASHMLLSALECEAEGLTFASVHDSFWTHAADVDDMGRILRDAFIRIHSEDVIGRLKVEFEARYKGHLCRTRITKTSPVGQAIMEHRKKARLTPVKELILEKQRLDLLASRNPKEVKMGEKMVTPGSIFAELASFQDIAETESQAVLAEEEEAEDAEEGMEATEETHERQVPVFGPEGHPLRGGNVLALHLQKATKKAPVRKPARQMTEVWLPLTFPEVPAKGDFDVRVLRDSPYFFN